MAETLRGWTNTQDAYEQGFGHLWCFHQVQTAEWVTLLGILPVNVIGESSDYRDCLLATRIGATTRFNAKYMSEMADALFFKICHPLRRLHLVKTPSAAGKKPVFGRQAKRQWENR